MYYWIIKIINYEIDLHMENITPELNSLLI